MEKKAQRSLVKGRVCVCFIFILFLTVLGLRCCMQVFSNCGELLFFAGHGLFIAGFLLLQSTGFGVRISSVVAVRGLSCPESCGIFLGQASNLCPLYWQVASFGICLIYLFLIGRYLLYIVVLVSAIHQHESAIGIHTSLPS